MLKLKLGKLNLIRQVKRIFSKKKKKNENEKKEKKGEVDLSKRKIFKLKVRI